MKLFETRADGLPYCLTDIEWIVTANSVESINGMYKCVGYGSILKSNTEKEYHTFTLGTAVITNPFEVLDMKDDYIKFVYRKGDKFLESSLLEQSTDNIYKIINTFTSGRVSNRIPYEKYYDILVNGFQSNGGFGAPNFITEMMVGTLTRSASNPRQAYRLKPEGDYLPVSLVEMTLLGNAWSALTSEYATRALVATVGNSRKVQEAKASKIEKALM
ncbi:MAG: hypothetical protein ACRCX2_20330 [Paraclostridium sp.]